MEKRLTVLLPTCEPESMFQFLLPTSYRLKQLSNQLQFNIIFQPPYTNEQIDRVVNILQANGFTVNYQFKDYQVVRPYTPLIKMRNDCSMMSPNSDFYLIWDDDISIEKESACDYILDAINRFDSNSNLAVISLYNQPIENHRENFYSTNGGLILRGGKYYGFKGYMPENLKQFGNVKTLIPYQNENLINLFGGFQDKFGSMCRLATGQTGESIINVPINHVENRKQKGAIQHGWDQAKTLDGSIASFILRYFNPDFLRTHSLSLFDPQLSKLIYPNHYDSLGNIKLEFDLYDTRGFAWWFNYKNIKEWYLMDPNESNKQVFRNMLSNSEPLTREYKKDVDFYGRI